MLDPFTMLFATALTTSVCGLLLLACSVRDRSAPLLTWAIAMFVAAVGLLATSTLDHTGARLDGAGTATLILAAALFWTATRLFCGARARWLLAVAGPLAWLGLARLHTDTTGWTAVSTALGAAYTAASLRELLLIRDEHLPSWMLVVALTVCHTAVYAARATLALLGEFAPDRVAVPGWIGVALLAEAVAHIAGSAIVLVTLVRERQEGGTRDSLRQAALQDSLTGIANRRRFDERLDELAADSRQRAARTGLVLIDLDHFKAVNDTIGHSEGDRILRAVAQIIASNVRPDTDLAARYGGEEFGVLVPNASMGSLHSLAERIRAAVEAAAIAHPGTGGVITLSAGIAVIETSKLALHRHEFLSVADQALYEAKQLGRNRVSAGTRADTPADAGRAGHDIGDARDIVREGEVPSDRFGPSSVVSA